MFLVEHNLYSVNTLHLQNSAANACESQSLRENTGSDLRAAVTFSSITLVVGGYKTEMYSTTLSLISISKNHLFR